VCGPPIRKLSLGCWLILLSSSRFQHYIDIEKSIYIYMSKCHQKPQKGAKLFPPMAIIFFHEGGSNGC
jgi:hypothetical protein